MNKIVVRNPDEPVGTFDELSLAECLGFLAGTSIGRIAVLAGGYPLVFPVNYKLVERATGGPVIVLRTRPGSTISQSGEAVGFEIDGIDTGAEAGWSVLVRGALHHVPLDQLEALGPFADPHPWAAGRDDWLIILPITVTGRRIVSGDSGWGFHPSGYV